MVIIIIIILSGHGLYPWCLCIGLNLLDCRVHHHSWHGPMAFLSTPVTEVFTTTVDMAPWPFSVHQSLSCSPPQLTWAHGLSQYTSHWAVHHHSWHGPTAFLSTPFTKVFTTRVDIVPWTFSVHCHWDSPLPFLTHNPVFSSHLFWPHSVVAL